VKVRGNHKHAHICTYTHSRESNPAIIKAFCIKYCKILNKVIQEAKKQLTAKPDNKTKTTWNIIQQEIGEIHVTEQMPSLLIPPSLPPSFLPSLPSFLPSNC
jgi:hypothetical protein